MITGADCAEESFSPFNLGNGRMSELTVEQLFGRLRRRQANAQMSAMQFWDSSQKEMVLAAKRRLLAQDGKPNEFKEKALTDKQWHAKFVYFWFFCIALAGLRRGVYIVIKFNTLYIIVWYCDLYSPFPLLETNRDRIQLIGLVGACLNFLALCG